MSYLEEESQQHFKNEKVRNSYSHERVALDASLDLSQRRSMNIGAFEPILLQK